ncbi:MAG: dTMP kinase [Desulfobacterales bacterium]|nr:dTMP kinase [Desulfobacterales bacterium]
MVALSTGALIVFEGIDGTGKSTQLALLSSSLKKEGYDVITTREPTDGKYGRQIRALYSNRVSVSREQELDLFLSDREEHVNEVIGPSLALKKIVLCDRYFLSTAAYQGAAGFDPLDIIERNSFAPMPDLALLLEISPEESIRRITEKRGDLLNDFEQLESLKQVDAIFSAMQLPYIRRIDASKTVGQIHQQISIAVTELLQQLRT